MTDRDEGSARARAALGRLQDTVRNILQDSEEKSVRPAADAIRKRREQGKDETLKSRQGTRKHFEEER